MKRELHYIPDPNSAPTIISPVWLKPGTVRAPANGLPGRLPFPNYTSMFPTPGGPVVPANHFMPQTSSSQSYFLGPTPGISDLWMHQIPKLLPTAPSTNPMPLTVCWDMIYPTTNASLPSSSYNDANIGPTDFTAQAPDSDQHQSEGGQA
ncbi:hypothetical protein SERLA73DRAFT_134505 [Serpula lacrymans var. lacrymans S7.3]|uniref:Uncharacterized protein n=2 Tax=Serpula lacrymans var. lacrymans TaxID=341189 RepID=F8PRY0_SERL3|nr:hypothetical protein SERLA73DRAFT_134505 [Serpula lacrymans var. lacrymans S7.3]